MSLFWELYFGIEIVPNREHIEREFTDLRLKDTPKKILRDSLPSLL